MIKKQGLCQLPLHVSWAQYPLVCILSRTWGCICSNNPLIEKNANGFIPTWLRLVHRNKYQPTARGLVLLKYYLFVNFLPIQHWLPYWRDWVSIVQRGGSWKKANLTNVWRYKLLIPCNSIWFNKNIRPSFHWWAFIYISIVATLPLLPLILSNSNQALFLWGIRGVLSNISLETRTCSLDLPSSYYAVRLVFARLLSVCRPLYKKHWRSLELTPIK